MGRDQLKRLKDSEKENLRQRHGIRSDTAQAGSDRGRKRKLLRLTQSDFFPTCHYLEFIAEKVRDSIAAVGSELAYIEQEPPSENGYCESFNARFGDDVGGGTSVGPGHLSLSDIL